MPLDEPPVVAPCRLDKNPGDRHLCPPEVIYSPTIRTIMDWVSTQLPYSATGFFSRIISDYLEQAGELSSFYSHPVSADGFRAAIEARRRTPVDRNTLVKALTEQYAGMEPSDK